MDSNKYTIWLILPLQILTGGIPEFWGTIPLNRAVRVCETRDWEYGFRAMRGLCNIFLLQMESQPVEPANESKQRKKVNFKRFFLAFDAFAYTCSDLNNLFP